MREGCGTHFKGQSRAGHPPRAGVPDLVGWVFKKTFLSTQQNSLN